MVLWRSSLNLSKDGQKMVTKWHGRRKRGEVEEVGTLSLILTASQPAALRLAFPWPVMSYKITYVNIQTTPAVIFRFKERRPGSRRLQKMRQ